MTGARGALGAALLALLGERAVPFDRRDGQELADAGAVAAALRGCDAVAHLAALHPLVAPPDADDALYRASNVAPLRVLLAAAGEAGVARFVFASSTSVWRDAPEGAPARFVDETSPADGDGPYARSKLEGERLLAASGLPHVVLRLARLAREGDPEDEVRKLYRAVDARDAASAVAAALDREPHGALYAVSAPTPFRLEDAALLARDPAEAIRMRTGRRPAWAPASICGVVRSDRARAELGWIPRYGSALLAA